MRHKTIIWKNYGRPTEIQKCSMSGKNMYDKKSAQSESNRRYEKEHSLLRIYECPYCNTWHLTSRID